MPSDRRLRRAVAVWDTPGFTKKLSSQQLAEKRLSEIKNGRLAMIGMVRPAFRPAPPCPPPSAHRGQRPFAPQPFAPQPFPPSLRCGTHRRPVACCTP